MSNFIDHKDFIRCVPLEKLSEDLKTRGANTIICRKGK
jgi:hypothetical protein